jgi:hypothetical protein
VGLRAGLDIRLEEKSFVSAGDRTPVIQSSSDTMLTDVPRLRMKLDFLWEVH